MPLTKETVRQFQEWVPTRFDVSDFAGNDLRLKKGSRASYDPLKGEIKITLTFVLGDENEGLKADFRQWAEMYKLEKDDWGKTFTTGGTEYRVHGIRSNRCKRPIICKRVKDGREFVFECHLVRIFLHAPKNAAVVTFKDEDEDGRHRPLGPCRILDKNNKEIYDFGWLTKDEAFNVARHAHATFREV